MIIPELRDRVVLVTGGANGIGEAVVRAFHQQGARVYFCDREVEQGTKLARSLGPGCEFHRVDLTREKQIQTWVRKLRGRVDTFDVLVNNAGWDPRIPLEKTTVRDWDQLFALNLRAYFLMCRETVPAMGQGGSIINLASITIHQGPAGMSAYVATKGGVLGLTRSLARELGPRGIRVNTLSPGWVMTERQLRMYVTPAARKQIHAGQSLPGLIQPEEIADVALFLASPASRAMTGQELLVDRGWYHT